MQVMLQATARSAASPVSRCYVTRHRFGRVIPTHLPAYALDEIESAPVQTPLDKHVVISSARDFLQVEVDRVFKTGAVTRARYADNVTFADPVSKLESLNAYQFSLQLLQLLFNINYTVHAVEITAENEVTARFSMTLEAKGVVRPKVVITGRSIFKIELETGKIISHVDEWDAVQDNQFLSVEALNYLISQLGESSLMLTPDLETPAYELLKKTRDYEIRRYSTFLVAETSMGPGTGIAGGNGFNELAGYIFGGNTSNVKMEMTTPVFTSVAPGREEPVMQFVIEDKYANSAVLPEPSNPRVSTRTEGGTYVAAAKFGGLALDWEVAQIEQQLRRKLENDGLMPMPGFQLARYNEPFVPPPFRRNEVLVTLDGFKWP